MDRKENPLVRVEEEEGSLTDSDSLGGSSDACWSAGVLSSKPPNMM